MSAIAKRRGNRRLLGPRDWLAVARAELIAGGISAVKVDKLARRLRVTRGSFYWHFKSHAQLLRDLLKSWEESNTAPFERAAAQGSQGSTPDDFRRLVNIWVDENDYSAAFDTAVRDWARFSREAAQAVHRTDDRRIAILHGIFTGLGYGEPEALVRARITYFQQVGYYALEFREDPQRRRELVSVYVQVLLGPMHSPRRK